MKPGSQSGTYALPPATVPEHAFHLHLHLQMNLNVFLHVHLHLHLHLNLNCEGEKRNLAILVSDTYSELHLPAERLFTELSLLKPDWLSVMTSHRLLVR